MKTSVSSMAQKFSIVINFPSFSKEFHIIDLENLLKKELFKNYPFYAFIVHSSDKCEDDITFKTPHIHLLLFTSCRTRVLKIINDISFLVGFPKECISVEPCNCDYLYAQYLTHKNDDTKFQYPLELVRTNNYEKFYQLYDKVYDISLLNDDEIFDIIVDCDNFDEVILRLGINYVNSHWRVVNYIFHNSNRKFYEDTIKEVKRNG